ncbi:MAG: hypothetical protein RLZZ244_151 [Verrucomicrobiota bacterium]
MRTMRWMLGIGAIQMASGGMLHGAGVGPLLDKGVSLWEGKVKLDFEVMYRGEYRNNNFDFAPGKAANGTDDSWLLQRYRVGLLYGPMPGLKFYVQGQDSRELGSARADVPGRFGAEGDDTFDFSQAWMEIGDSSKSGWSLKLGRQVLSFGDERLVGPLEWLNFARRFDAARLTYNEGPLKVTGFASSPMVSRKDGLNRSDWGDWNGTGRNQYFSGLYASYDAKPFGAVDGYLFHLTQQSLNAGNLEDGVVSYTSAAARAADHAAGSNFLTLGTRLKGDPKRLGGWEAELEAAGQVGEVGGRDLRAWAFHAGTGYNFKAPLKPRVFFDYNYGSGDRDPNDGKVQTFQNLFPTNHKWYGFIDAFSWQNIHNPQVTLQISPTNKTTLRVDHHAFWLAQTDDAWYRANGVARVRTLNATARAADRYVGQELDLTAIWKLNRNFSLQAGYSHFFSGTYVRQTGKRADADFAYLMTNLAF